MNKYYTTKHLSGKSWVLLFGIVMSFGLIISYHSSSAQAPSGASTAPDKANFYQIQKHFNDYWEGKKITRGSGYKPFKRWEWYWQQRVNPDGSFPPNNVLQKEWESYSATKQTADPAGDWKPIGPDDPKGDRYFGIGRVNCIAFHPTIPGTFWIGTPAGGLWKTTNFGQNWSTTYDNQPVLGISEIVVNPKNADIMYLATGDYDGNNVASVNNSGAGDTKSIGVLKSVNGGQTWVATQLNWNLSDEARISRLIMHPTDTSLLFAATSKGIYRLTQGGQVVEVILSSAGIDFSDIAFNPGDSKIMYAASRSNASNYARIFRSDNSGNIWNPVREFNNVSRIKIAVSKKQTNLVEALCVKWEGEGMLGIYRSNDDGKNFYDEDIVVKVDANCSNNYLNSSSDPLKDETPCKGQGNYDLCYLINPNVADERWLGGVNTWKSINGGTTFSLVNCWDSTDSAVPPKFEMAHADKHWFAFHPLQPTTFFECNDGGVYYTTDGGKKWTDITRGMQIGQIYRIAGSWMEENTVVAGFQDNGSQVRIAPGEWLTPMLIGGDGMECLVDWLDPKIKYASYMNGEIKRTTDGTWSKANLNIISKNIPDKPTGAWITPYIIHPVDPEILYAGYRKIYKTTDRGETWSSLFTVPSNASKDSDTLVRTLAISQIAPEVMWAATEKKLFRTSDEWKNYDSVRVADLPALKYTVTGIATHPTKPNTAFVTVSGYSSLKVFRTDNGGTTWKDISGTSLPKVPVNCITYEDFSRDALYIGTDLGVFYRDSTMDNWIMFNKNLPNVIVTDLEIEYATGKIRAATLGRGIWESDLYIASGYNKVNDVEIPKNSGVATGGGLYQTGAKVKMTATPAKSIAFLGWYEEGVKVCDSSIYEFIIEKNHNLVAKFGNPEGIGDQPGNKIHLFPNPTRGILEISLDKGFGDDLQKIKVTNMQGSSIYESAAKSPDGHYSVDLSANASGIYMITFYFKTGEKASCSFVITK
jgi:photosystem II stability/assembly factor-like uncharacterized protein